MALACGTATVGAGLALTAALGPQAVAAADLSGFARVTDQGTLVVDGREVALAGIDLLTTDRTCRRVISPPRCGPRAVLILDDMIRGFVHCDVVAAAANPPQARCTIAPRRRFDERLDLAAELLREGWAFARDDAPGFYRSLERLARSKRLGMWGDSAIDLH